MTEKDGAPTVESDGGAGQDAKFRFPYKSIVALVVIVVLGLPAFSMLQPRYFERYPDLKSRMHNWSTSTHARIPCSGCHVDPGPQGAIRFGIEAIPAFYSQLLHGPRPSNLLQVPDRFACQKCHTNYRQVSPNGDLLIPHRAHVEVLKINCPVCHKNLVHSRNTEGFNAPEMSTCLNLCHNGVKATNKCVKCHTRKQVPDNHKQPSWLQIHSTMTEKVNCGTCHGWAPNYCRQCHQNRPASHAGNWKKLHQFRVKERGTKGCYFCHGGQRFCKKCHD